MANVNLTTLNNLQATPVPTQGGLQNILNVNVVSGGGGGSSNTSVTVLYTVTTAFAGANVGDTIAQTEVLSSADGSIVSTTWTNVTQNTTLSGAPPSADIVQQASSPLTNAQLRATPVPVTVTNGGPQTQFVVQSYKVVTAFTGANVGDLLQQVQEFNTSTVPATLSSTIWINSTQETTLSSVPPSNNIVPLSSTASAVTVTSGSITANAGTNLNTSTLALESGGNLASINTKIPAQGQALAAGSLPVVLPAAQITALTPTSTTAAGTTATLALPVQGVTNGVPMPISGTVTANLGTTDTANLATVASAQGSNGTGITQPTGGSGVLGWLSGIYKTLTGTLTTSVSNFPATQAVSGSVTATNGGTFAVQNTAAIVGGNTLAVKTDSSGVTQPISATALPLPTGASTSALQTTGNTSLTSIATAAGTAIMQSTGGTVGLVAGSATIGSVKVTDGTNTGAVTAASTAATATQPAQVVALSPNTPLPAGTNTLGTVSVQNASFTGSGYLNVNVGSSTFSYSANNSTNGASTAYSLTTGNTWSGTLESTINQTYMIVAVNSTQNVTLSLFQYIDSGGTILEVPTKTWAVTGGTPYNTTIAIDGNYSKLTVSNASGSTATLYVDTYYGSLPVNADSLTQSGNMKEAVQEWNVPSTTLLGKVGIDQTTYGTTNAVSVGGSSNTQVTPTVTASSAYTTGMVVGGVQTFANPFQAGALSGVAMSMRVGIKSTQASITGLAIAWFKSVPTGTFTDKTAPAIATADVANLITIQALTASPVSLGSNLTWYESNGLGIDVVGVTNNLYAVLIVTGTPTFLTSSDVVMTLGVMKD